MERTVVVFEAPHRLEATLADLATALGPDRPVAVARELTKVFETVWRGTLGEAAAHQHRDAVGEAEHRVHVVLDEQHRRLRAHLVDEGNHARRFLRAHARHRLVEQHELRPRGEGKAHFEHALLAVRQRHRHGAQACLQADLGTDGPGLVEQCALVRHGAPEAEARAAARLHGERQVFEDAVAAKDAGDLVAAREARSHPGMRGEARDVRSVEKDAAAVGGEHARDLADERGLAGAVWADDGMHFAARDIQRDVVSGHHAAIALGDGAQLKHGAAARKAPRALAARA